MKYGLNMQRKINILFIGIGGSFLVFFLIYTLVARILVSTILDSLDSYFALLLIVVGLELISFIASILVGIWLTDKFNRRAVYKASIFAFILNFLFLTIMSYIFMWIFYPVIFSEVNGFEVALMWPSVLIYFSIYILGHPIYLIILSIFSYFILFIIFLGKFY